MDATGDPLASAPLVLLARDPNPARARTSASSWRTSASDLLEQQLSPENIQRTLAPHLTGEPYPIRTADGWTLVAHRFRPTARPGRAPCR